MRRMLSLARILFLLPCLLFVLVSADECENELGAPCANGAKCNTKTGAYVSAFCECEGDYHGLTCETPGKLDRVIPQIECVVYDVKKPAKIGTKSFIGVFINKIGEKFAGNLKLPDHELSFDKNAFINEKFSTYVRKYDSQLNYYNTWMQDEAGSRGQKGSELFFLYPVSTKRVLTDFECLIELGNVVDDKVEVQYRAKFKINVVQNPGGCVPQVELQDCSQDSSKMVNWNKGTENIARSTAERGCPSLTTTFVRKWAVLKMCTLIDGDPKSMPYPLVVDIPDYYFGRCIQSVVTAEATKELTIPAFTLKYGVTAITLFVTENVPANAGKTSASNNAVCWVNVKPVPLKAKIAGADFKTVSEKTKVVLDGSPSYDPNESSDNQKIRYQWSCFVVADPADADCKKDVLLGEDVKFVPSFKLKIGNPYSFQLRIESGLTGATIPDPDVIIQQISVIAGSPPKLDIECILNCEYVSRASHTEVIFLQVYCTESCAENTTPEMFEWSSDASPDLDWDTDTYFGKRSDKLAIREGVLKEGLVYTFTVTLQGPLGTSMDKYTIKVNKRPILATNPPCTWNPASGTVATDFVVTCTGFKDDEEDWPLRFYIYQSDSLDHGGEENYGVVMAYLLVEFPWHFESPPLRLMEGEADKDFKSTITVKVKDHFGMDAIYSFELQINERTPWSMEMVTLMYDGQDPTSPHIPSVKAMLDGGDSSRAVRLMATLSRGLSRIPGGDDDEELKQFQIDMKEKFVDDLGTIPVKTASALDQVSGALQQVLQEDKKAIHHGSARKASRILYYLSKYLLTRAYKDILPGHLPTKEVKKITQTILSSLSSIMIGVSDDPKPVTPPPESQQDIDYPYYEDYEHDAVESVVDSNMAATYLIESIDILGKSIAYRLAEALGDTDIHTEHVQLCVIVDRPTKLIGRFLGDNEAGVNISRELGEAIQKTSPVINLQVATTKKNPFWFKKHLAPMNADYVFFSVYDRKPKIFELEQRSGQRTPRSIGYKPGKPLDIFLPLQATGKTYTENETTINLTRDYLDLEYEIIVYKVVVDEGALLRVDFKDDASYPNLSAVVTRDERPGIEDFDKAYSIPSASGVGPDAYAILFPEKVEDGKSEWFYVGILPNLDEVKKNIAEGKTSMEFKYAFMLSSIKCCYWSLRKNKWMSEGCIMMPDTNKQLLHCQCKHLSLFSGSFVTTPSKIDPYHALDLLLTTMFDNLLILCVIVAILILLLLLLIWACFKKRHDAKARCITVLEDNRYYDRCGYVVAVHTGRQWQAGTSANIGIQLLGSNSNSNTHILKDSARRTLERCTDCWFLMFTRENLGEIKAIRLWSDCSGHYPGWFCDKITVTCLETKCTQAFLVNNWFSLTHGDGKVNRLISSANKEEIFKSKQLFMDYFHLGFRDNHLWFGIWFLHPRSRFTRMQRVVVLACFIMTVMFVNLVLYGIPNSGNPATQIDDFAYSITIKEIGIAIAGLLIALLVAITISLFFVKSKYVDDKEGKKSNFNLECHDDPFAEIQVGEKARENSSCLFNDDDFELVGGSKCSRAVFSLLMAEPLVPASTCKAVTGAKSPRCICEVCECPPKKTVSASGDCSFHLRSNRHIRSSSGSGYSWFPHWFVYVAWTICFCVIILSATFIIYFGSMFGDVKTWLWLTSVIAAMIISLLIVEPLKITLIAFLHARVFRKCPKTMRPDCDIDVKHGGKKESAFQFNNYEDRVKHRKLRKMYRPLAIKEREKIKDMIELRTKVADMCIDLFLFVIFIICLYVVVWYSRDTLAFESTKNIHNMVVAGTYGTKSEFEEVNSMVTFQKYLEETVIHGLQATDNYNDQPTNEVGMTSDFSTHLLGIPRLRQLRVRTNTCTVHPLFNGTITECHPEYGWYNSDTSNYSVGWTHKWKANEDLGAKLKDPWLFKDAQETDSLPMRGQFATYPGSGYVANLGRTRRNSLIVIQFLLDYEWFDLNTRVVFVEFSTYSSSRNLFNVVALVTERGATGRWETTENTKTVKLLVTTSEASVGGKIAFAVCAIVLFLHLARNLSKFYSAGWKKFFTHMWNVVDLFIVCLCIACIVLYVNRSSYVSALLKQLEDTQHNEYVSFQAAAFWDIILGYAIAVLVCIATVRIWKLLRFGDKFRMLEMTLYSAASALMSLLITLMLMMCMFVLFSYLLMGTTVEHFRDPYRALTTLLASTIGFHDLDMDELWAAHPLLGPLFFLFFLIASTIYMVNMFITVVVCYYEAAQWDVVEKKSSYGPIDYLRDELRFHFGICKKKHKRLRGGADSSTYPIALSKPEKIRQENAESLSHNRMEAMRLLTVDSLKTGVKGRDVEADESQDVSNERLEAMLLITLDELGKDDDKAEEEEEEVFYRGRTKDDVKFVPETRIQSAENLVNKFGKSRKTVNRETLKNEAGGEMSEEYDLLNRNLDYLSHLLDQLDFDKEALETEIITEKKPLASKSKQKVTPIPESCFFSPPQASPEQDTTSQGKPSTRPARCGPKRLHGSCRPRPHSLTSDALSTPKSVSDTAFPSSKSDPHTTITTSKSEPDTTTGAFKCQPISGRFQRPLRCKQSDAKEKITQCLPYQQGLTQEASNVVSNTEPDTSNIASNTVPDISDITSNSEPDISNIASNSEPDISNISSNTVPNTSNMVSKSESGPSVEPSKCQPVSGGLQRPLRCKKNDRKEKLTRCLPYQQDLEASIAASNTGPGTSHTEPNSNITCTDEQNIPNVESKVALEISETAPKSELKSSKKERKSELDVIFDSKPDTAVTVGQRKQVTFKSEPEFSKSSSKIEIEASSAAPNNEPDVSQSAQESEPLSDRFQKSQNAKVSGDDERNPATSAISDAVLDEDTRRQTELQKRRHDSRCHIGETRVNLEDLKPTTALGEKSGIVGGEVLTSAGKDVPVTTIEAGKRPPGCKRKTDKRKLGSENSEETQQHIELQEPTTREQVQRPNQDSRERKLPERVQGCRGKHKKRHHRSQCPRCHDSDIPQCQKRLARDQEGLQTQRRREGGGNVDEDDMVSRGQGFG